MTVAALATASELQWLRDALSDLTIRFDWDDCNFSGSTELAEWLGFSGGGAAPEILICDLTLQGALEELRELRRRNRAALVVPIVNPEIRPSDYVHPDILPYALLWSPLTGPGNLEMLRRALSSAYSGAEDEASQKNRLTVSTRRETRQIPFGEIYYFEAREKRVFIHLAEQEIPINETIASLEQRLPERFIRCHKGFLINRDFVSSVDWQDLTIHMGRNLTVPISRGCRAEVRGKLNEAV